MARSPADRVQVSITLDDEVVRRLQAQAAKRSVSLADYVEKIVRAAALGPASTVASEAKSDTRPEGPLPSSIGMADVDFDARDTDSWLAAHWGRE